MNSTLEKSNDQVRVTTHTSVDDLVRLRFEARGFSLLPRQPVNSLLSGRHASRLRGRGLTFEELRDYRPGDDIRSIDWKATARLRKTHVRVYTEERERPVLLVVDQRTSMFFGSQRTTKSTAAAELTALAAWRALDSGDRVGAIIFGDEEVTQIKPHRSRNTVLRICGELARMNQKLSSSGTASNSNALNEALRRAVEVAKHDYLVVIATDFADADHSTSELTSYLAAHNDIVAALIYDPLGARIPVSGHMVATDGDQRVTLASDSRAEQRFTDAFRERCDFLRQKLRAIRVPILPICTHDPVMDQIRQAFGARQ